ncbi:alpha/beta fold hydrolase [Gilvimarinus agarilyticus]|uniref:alpha/beta fold hydrolase n=1 Tax=Gilvimarinus agarilyticus TaxID=679259 RepID=UPI000A069532|nr:alpha/beta fold hydrolase [Gilvimarinus agarilyticus]
MKESICVFLWCLSGAFVSVALSGCDKNAGRDQLRSAELLAPCERKADETPLVSGAECGYLTVPLTREQPDNTIELYIKRWPAISAAPEADPLFVIAGGPGQSATDIADMLAGSFYELRKKRDIVFVDQRGTGQSSPLHCELSESNQLLGHSAAATEESIAQYRKCANTLADRAPHYTTTAAVDDLEAVRQALGYSRINVWGGSYGTRVILAYLAHYPQSLRAVVMDGLAPVQLAMPYNIGAEANRALQRVADQCLALPACAERYGDSVAAAEQAASRLRAAPVTLSIDHPLTGLATPLLLDDSKLAGLVRFSLYDRLASRLLPAALSAAAQEDYRLVASLITRISDSAHSPNLALGMHMTILCNEDAGVSPRPSSADFLGVDLAAPVARICEFWPKADIAPEFYQPVQSDVPALLLSGERDPITPPRWAGEVAEGLSNATVLSAAGAHHGVTQVGCSARVIAEFIAETHVGDNTAACLKNIKPLSPYLSAPEQEQGGEAL